VILAVQTATKDLARTKKTRRKWSVTTVVKNSIIATVIPKKMRIPEADTMPFERWTAYMWSILLSKGLVKTHYITRCDGKSFIKPKQR
jgi:hypothetical protein